MLDYTSFDELEAQPAQQPDQNANTENPVGSSETKPETSDASQNQATEKQSEPIGEPVHTIFIHNLPYDESRDLESKFSKYGEIARFFGNQISTRGIAFITYYDLRDSIRALEALNRAIIGGRDIKANYAMSKQPADGRPVDLFSSVMVTFEEDVPAHPQLIEQFSKFGEIKTIDSDESQPKCVYIRYYDIRAARTAVAESSTITFEGKFNVEPDPHLEGGSQENMTRRPRIQDHRTRRPDRLSDSDPKLDPRLDPRLDRNDRGEALPERGRSAPLDADPSERRLSFQPRFDDFQRERNDHEDDFRNDRRFPPRASSRDRIDRFERDRYDRTNDRPNDRPNDRQNDRGNDRDNDRNDRSERSRDKNDRAKKPQTWADAGYPTQQGYPPGYPGYGYYSYPYPPYPYPQSSSGAGGAPGSPGNAPDPAAVAAYYQQYYQQYYSQYGGYPYSGYQGDRRGPPPPQGGPPPPLQPP